MRLIKIALRVAYDGTDFDGWQDNGQNKSIEGCLKAAFLSLYHTPHALDAASRTDKGVHAQNQIVIAQIDADKIPLNRLANALNSKLPLSIRVKDIKEVADTFHPSLGSKWKTYTYRINQNLVSCPFSQITSWHLPELLDFDSMVASKKHFLGKKDFSSFTNQTDKETIDPICELKNISLEKTKDGFLTVTLTGDRFLYKMCRILVGTLVAVGKKTIQSSSIPQIFESKNRSLTGITAPACGLVLTDIEYHVPL